MVSTSLRASRAAHGAVHEVPDLASLPVIQDEKLDDLPEVRREDTNEVHPFVIRLILPPRVLSSDTKVA